MAEVKEIRLKFIADDSQAAPKMKATGDAIQQMGDKMQKANTQMQSGNNALFATNQIVRDLPFGFIAISNNIPILTDQFSALRLQTGSTTLAFKAMWASMMGPAGISLAIAVVTSLITTWSLSNRGAKSDTDGMTESVDKQKQAFDALKSSIESASKARLADLTTALQIERINIRAEIARTQKETPEQTQRLKEIDEAIKLAKQEFATVGLIAEQRRKISELRDQAEKAQTRLELTAINRQIQIEQGKLKELETIGLINEAKSNGNKITEEQLKQSAFINALYSQELELIDKRNKLLASSPFLAGQRTNFQFNMQGTDGTLRGGYDVLDPERVKVDFSLLEDLTLSWANVLRMEGMQSFEDIFGEANSLLEKLIQATVAEFMNLGAKQLAGYLFNLALPGATSIFQFLFGRSGTNTTVINLDGKVLGEFVQSEVPYAMARANTLRIA